MRVCPVCLDSRREVIQTPYCPDLQIYTPESGTSYFQWSLFKCAACSMLYLDTEGHTEESLNKYYIKDYVTDDLPYSDDRLNSLVKCLVDLPIAWGSSIMDIGGMDAVLSYKLLSRGFTDVAMSGPGAQFVRKFGIFILSHTLEHVYNTHGMLEKIKAGIERGGYVVVEVPIWDDDSPMTYDYHWQHINKFTPGHLAKLFNDHGFRVNVNLPMPKYREYNCQRLVTRYYG